MSCERLGLNGDTEAAIRKVFRAGTGMLVVSEVQPGSPAYGQLQPGDVLVKVNDRYVTQFEPLEELLDDSIGQSVQARAAARRHDGGDAAARSAIWMRITPDAFLEFGEAVVQRPLLPAGAALQPAGARRVCRQPRLRARRAGVPRGALISAVNGRPVPTPGAISEARARRARRRRSRHGALHDDR